MKRFLDWVIFKQLEWAAAVVRKHGYTVARIEHIAGSDYILDPSGTRHRIGRKK